MRKLIAGTIAAVALATAPAAVGQGHELNRARDRHAQIEQGWRAEYLRLSGLAGQKPRRVVWNKGPSRAQSVQDQQRFERRVHLWKRGVYAQLLRDAHKRIAYMRTTAYLYDVRDRQGVRAMVMAALDQQGVDAHGRYCILDIIDGESEYDPNADNPTSTALGLMQFLDSWGSDFERADPVWSILRAIRYYREEGHFDPWTETAPGSCLS